MIRPSVVGGNVIYDAPAASTLTTANLATIDSAANVPALYMWAKSATVESSFDEMLMYWDLQTIASAQKNAFGLFLSPDLTLGSLVFMVSGQIIIRQPAADEVIAYPVFGRTTDAAVVSSVAAPENLLANYTILPCKSMSGYYQTNVSFQTQVYSKYLSTGQNYCLGWVLSNVTGAGRGITVYASLSFAKFNTNYDCFSPDRS